MKISLFFWRKWGTKQIRKNKQTLVSAQNFTTGPCIPIAYYQRKHWTGFVNKRVWAPPIVLCQWVSHFWVCRDRSLSQQSLQPCGLTPVFLLSHSSWGVLLSWHPHGRPLCVFFHPLSGCSSAPLSVLSCCYYTPVTHSLHPSFCTFFHEAHLPSSERDTSGASFCEHTNTLLYTRGRPGVPLFFHFSVTLRPEQSVSVCFLAEWHGINFQACCISNWHCWCFINATPLVRCSDKHRAGKWLNTHV